MSSSGTTIAGRAAGGGGGGRRAAGGWEGRGGEEWKAEEDEISTVSVGREEGMRGGRKVDGEDGKGGCGERCRDDEEGEEREEAVMGNGIRPRFSSGGEAPAERGLASMSSNG
jgi:hypothetical protein